MNIHTGDYVTLKSVEEVKFFYKFWDVANNGCVNAGTNYFTNEMLDVMGTSNMYKVVRVKPDYVLVDIEGTLWRFDKRCIKDIYRLTKVN